MIKRHITETVERYEDEKLVERVTTVTEEEDDETGRQASVYITNPVDPELTSNITKSIVLGMRSISSMSQTAEEISTKISDIDDFSIEH